MVIRDRNAADGARGRRGSGSGAILRGLIWPVLVLCSLGFLAAGRLQRGRGWHEISPGMEYRRLEAQASDLGDTAVLHVLRVDLKHYRIRLLRAGKEQAASIRELAGQSRAAAAINGGFFDEELRPLGLRVTGGKELRPLRRANWGVFVIRNGKPAILHARDYRPEGVTEALQCGPRLVVNGEVTRLKKQYARRACIGIDRAGRVLLAVTNGSTMDATYLARVLRAPEPKSGLGCVNALNLDGGGSAQLYVDHHGFRLDLPGAWGVPDGLGVFPR